MESGEQAVVEVPQPWPPRWKASSASSSPLRDVRRSPASRGRSSAATTPDRTIGAVSRGVGLQTSAPTPRGFKPANIAESTLAVADGSGQA